MSLFSLYYFSENEIISAFEVSILVYPFNTIYYFIIKRVFDCTKRFNFISKGYIHVTLSQFCMQFYPVIDVFGDGIKIDQ